MKNDVLIKLREATGKTQEEIAKEIGISRSMYAMIEIGERFGRYPTLKKIADYFGKPVDEVFGQYFFEHNAHKTRHNETVPEVVDSDTHTQAG